MPPRPRPTNKKSGIMKTLSKWSGKQGSMPKKTRLSGKLINLPKNARSADSMRKAAEKKW